MKRALIVGSMLLLVVSLSGHAQTGYPVSTVTPDGVTLHGQVYGSELGTDAPLVLLFHQGGADGRGEYAPLTGWLNAGGFRAIAWDLRAGGDRFGTPNRTAAGLGLNVNTEYCAAIADLQAALTFVLEEGLATQVIAWGSSYSGSLVFQLAAANPHSVAGVLAFSPAAGGPLANCRARMWAAALDVPTLVFRPGSEMAITSVVEQREALVNAGVEFRVVENGVHGSSMLVDERTGHRMEEVRSAVMHWLREVGR